MTTMPAISIRTIAARRGGGGNRSRRGNALVLVTAVLVLLVIIATAYISRAQSIRAISSTQRQILGRSDAAELSTGAVADVIAADLFPRLVRSDDPGIERNLVSTSSTARPLVDEVRTTVLDYSSPNSGSGYIADVPVTRYMNDPQGLINNQTGVKEFFAPYNYAPYETKPWTNWPDGSEEADWLPLGRGATNGFLYDSLGLAIGDDNPIGNPGFGDSRWLRSTEPQRSYDRNGALVGEFAANGTPVSDNLRPGYTHWAHLSWIPDGNNGWRVCYDISNVAPYNRTETGGDEPDKYGYTLVETAAQLLNGSGTLYEDADTPVAIQTPYEQWLAGMTPDPYFGTDDFIRRRDLWFGSPQEHFFALATPADAMPNFMRLNDLGPPSDTYAPGTDRNVVERTLTDTDGDGWTDSFWYLLPGTTEDGVRQVAAVSIVDNASRVDVNVATRFDRWSTAGQTPADIALVGRLVAPEFQLQAFGEDASAYDPRDTWTGLLADPQNVWPQGRNSAWEFIPPYYTEFSYLRTSRLSEAPEEPLGVAYDPYRFGDSTLEPSTWLDRVGVTRYDATTDSVGLADPYNSLLAAIDEAEPGRGTFDRRRYFNRRQNTGGLYTIRTDAAGNLLPVDAWELGALAPEGFTDSDELELRMYESSNYGPVVSSLERAINRPWDYESNLLRSTLARAESVEPHLYYPYGVPTAIWPPTIGIPIGDQLTADQLLRDTRHRMTTYSATRNDLRPLHLRPTPEYNASFDYAFGRTYGGNSGISANRYQVIQGTAGTPEETRLMRSFSRAAYDARSQKLDLRTPLDGPLSEFEALLYQGVDSDGDGTVDADRPAFPDDRFGVAAYFQDVRGGADRIHPGLWPGDPGSGFNSSEAENFKLRVELDRAARFRDDLQATITQSMIALDTRGQNGNPPRTQSYWGSNFLTNQGGSAQFPATNGRAAQFTALMAASWAANIDCFRDNRTRPMPVQDFRNFTIGSPTVPVKTVLADAPIYPANAPGYASNGLPATMAISQNNPQGVVFPGLEAQPVIMETFFSLVYPPSRVSDEVVSKMKKLVNYPRGTNQFVPWYQAFLEFGPADDGTGSYPIDYDDIDFDSEEFRYKIPVGFEGSPSKFVDASSAPAIVFAIQIANPFSDPVPLQDIQIELAGQSAPNRLINLSALPSPQINPGQSGPCSSRRAPYFDPEELFLGPTLPEAPRTAIVFGIIPPRGVSPATFEETFRVPFPRFHAKWMDFMDLEPGALFGWEPGTPPCELQTLIFDASPQTFFLQRPDPDPVPNGLDVIATTALPRLLPFGWGTQLDDETGAIADSQTSPLFKAAPDTNWANQATGTPQLNRAAAPNTGSVRLLRRVYDPIQYSSTAANPFNQPNYVYEIDRLDNVLDGGTAILSEDLERLVEDAYKPPVPAFGPTGPGGDFEPVDSRPEPYLDGIILGQGDFFMTWARAGRPWGWDVNRNGVYDMAEISPRFAFSDFPSGDIIDDEITDTGPVRVKSTTRPRVIGKVVSFAPSDDPDELESNSAVGWPTRDYITPLAISAATGAVRDCRTVVIFRSSPPNRSTSRPRRILNSAARGRP